jgi:hypothetical protein
MGREMLPVSEDEEEEEEEEVLAQQYPKYTIPNSMQLKGAIPEQLDVALVGLFIFMKWDYAGGVTGWEVGSISEFFGKGFGRQKFNYDVTWLSDNTLGSVRLSLDNYGGGDDKKAGAWVLMTA